MIGYTVRATLTPFRRGLLERLPQPAKQFSVPERRQFGIMEAFGWVTCEIEIGQGLTYALTEAGRARLATKEGPP